MIPPLQQGRVLGRETSDCFRVVRRNNELAPRLERPAKIHYEMSNFRKGGVIVRFVPKTGHWAVCMVGGNDDGTNEEALLTVGEISKRHAERCVAMLKVNRQTS